MKKKVLSTLLVAAMTACMFAGCSTDTTTKSTTTPGGEDGTTTAAKLERPTLEDYGSGKISIWVADNIVDLTQEKADAFIAAHPEYAGYTVEVTANGEGTAATAVLTDLDAAADIFGFPQDQLARLVGAKALVPIAGSYFEQFVKENNDASSVAAAMAGKEMYAFPYTSDNGYFVYYDKTVVKHTDTLENMIKDCEDAKKSFYFDLNSGWYQTAFFFGTGCTLTYDTDDAGKFTKCNIDYNSDKGLVALKEMVEVAKSAYFVDGSDANAAVDYGFIVDGTWDKEAVIGKLGDNWAACKLPEFEGSDGKKYQLSGFGGFKLMGVKPQEDNKKQLVCLHLAEYLTGEEVQLARFEACGWGPSNLKAQANEKVQADPALAALGAQLAYTIPQGQYPGDYWTRAEALGNDAEIKDAGYTDDQLKDMLKKFEEDCKSYCNAE